MTYQKVTIQITPASEEISEIFVALLSEMQYEGFRETTNSLEAYIPSHLYVPLSKKNVSILNSPDYHFEISVEALEDINWNEEWEKNYFKPIIINDQCLIRSPFQEAPAKCRYEILIEPRMAFGTGYHETTSLMLQHLIETNLDGLRVLDMGCGTGILGILAAMKGARQVTAIDNDHWAVENARDNLQLNTVTNMTIEQGDAQMLSTLAPFDIIAANINRNILLQDMSLYNRALKPGGTIFMSGFYTQDIDKIHSEALRQQWLPIFTKTQNNWVALAYSKAAQPSG